MLKLHFMSVAVFLILSGGLISCTPEKKTIDVYQAPSPHIRDQKTSVSFQEWLASPEKQAQLNGVFDASDANPSRIETLAKCQKEGRGIQRESILSEAKAFKFREILPEEILASNFSEEKVVCSFTITLINEVQSKRILTTPPMDIKEDQSPELSFESSEPWDPSAILTPEKTRGLLLRFAANPTNEKPMTARIVCGQATSNRARFERVVDFSSFDFAALEVREGLDQNTLVRNPRQSCRVAIEQNSRLIGLSPLFKLQLPRANTEARVDFTTPNNDSQIALGQGQSFYLGKLLLFNPDPMVERVLRIPKTEGITIELFNPPMFQYSGLDLVSPNGPTGFRRGFARPWLAISPYVDSGFEIVDGGDQWQIRIPALSTLEVQLDIRPTAALNCEGAAVQYGLSPIHMMVSLGFSIFELDEKSEVIQTLPINQNRYPLSVTGMTAENMGGATEPNVASCQW